MTETGSEGKVCNRTSLVRRHQDGGTVRTGADVTSEEDQGYL